MARIGQLSVSARIEQTTTWVLKPGAFQGTDLIPRSDAVLFRALINSVYNCFDDFVGCRNTPQYV